MNDRETLIAMFRRANIKFEERDGDIIVESGYIGFASHFEFNKDGSLKSLGAYE